MSNPFGNPYEAEYPAGAADQGRPELGRSQSYPEQSPGAAPQSYLLASQMPGPVAPRNVAIVVGLLWALAAFMVLGVLMLLKNNSNAFVFGLSAMISVALALGLSKRPGKVVQALTTAYAGLWCLTGIGLLVSVPMVVLLWTQEAKDYFAAGERWNAARAAQHS